MNTEIKEALLRLRQRDEDSLAARLAIEINRLTAEMHGAYTAQEARRAESNRLDAVLAQKLADIAADAERETAVNDAYKKGFIDAWNLSR
tara:strand:+ start:461 stop:730 length:270 start_codon:yes stop_codon:yes gene_type:complete